MKQSNAHVCYRSLVQVDASGEFAVQGESGVLGLLAYNSADVLSAMKLSLYLLDMNLKGNRAPDYIEGIRRHVDNLESLVGIMRQLAITEEQILSEMQPTNLSLLLQDMAVRLSTQENLRIHLEVSPQVAHIRANLHILFSTLLTLTHYCHQSAKPLQQFTLQSECHEDTVRIAIWGRGMVIEPQAFNIASVCFCEGPSGQCTLKTVRSFQRNLQELTLANAQRIITVHGGRIYIQTLNPKQSMLMIELPLLPANA